jgi:AcrR family transcriptional regulator
MSNNSKMNGEARKASIIAAARIVFAEKGFDKASIKDIARAAGVSTPLLYVYFPSKEALHDACHDYARDVMSEVWAQLQATTPGTQALVTLVSELLRVIMLEVPGHGADQKSYEQLLFRSLLDDVAFAERHFHDLDQLLYECTVSSYQVAEAAGDLVKNPPAPGKALWFMHNTAMALNLCCLSGRPAFPWHGTRAGLYENAVLFCLRGMGLNEDAIGRYFNPEKLRGHR